MIVKNIVFINAPFGDNFVRSARWSAKSRGRVQRHPENALIALSLLRNMGHRVFFLEGAARNMTKKQVISKLKVINPDMVVIHTTTPSIYSDVAYTDSIKKINKQAITIAVGAHATAVPEDTLKISKNLDAVALGEYDYTLRDVAEGLDFSKVDGLVYRHGNKIEKTKNRKPLDVNELPYPAWDLINPNWYHDAGKRFPFLTLYSGRGCIGSCTFCREAQLMSCKGVRLRDYRKVVDEMEYDLKLYPQIKEIMFETDTFTAIPEYTTKTCEEIIKRGLNKKISWSCNVRVDIDLKLLPLMKEAGCRMLMVGFEFGTQKALDAVKKGVTLKQSKEFANRASELGFIIHGCFMIGAPGESEDSARKTVEFAKSLPLDTVQFSGICLYPGTEMYNWAKEKGYLLVDKWTDWVDNEHEQRTILDYPELSKDRIDYYVDLGLRQFYVRPEQVWRMIKNIKSPSDLLRKFYGFTKFLDYFVK